MASRTSAGVYKRGRNKFVVKEGCQVEGLGGYDVIVERVFDYKNSTSSAPIVTLNLVRGSFAELKAKIEAGKPVSGYIRYTGIPTNGEHSSFANFVAAEEKGDTVYLYTAVSDAWGKGVLVADNDTVVDMP